MSVIVGSGSGDDFLDALANAVGAPRKKKQRGATPDIKPPLREAVIATMKELAAVYGKCPFKIGDLVTPRKGLNIRDAGSLHMVVHVEPDAQHHFTTGEDRGSFSIGYGRYLDVRVISYHYDGDEWLLLPFWMESWTLQPYDPDEDPHYNPDL